MVLPEGASEVSWRLPFDVDSATIEQRTSYLDMHGRTVLVLRKRNVVHWHNQNLEVWLRSPSSYEPVTAVRCIFAQVSYRFSRAQLMQKPLMLVFGELYSVNIMAALTCGAPGFFALFLAAMFYMRLDFSLIPRQPKSLEATAVLAPKVAEDATG